MTDSPTYSVIAFSGPFLPATYRSLIFAKWLRSLRHGNDFFKLIHTNDYYATYNRLIDALLRKPESVVRLAVLSDDPDVALGFSVCRGSILEYVYVHRDHRRQHIGTLLVPKHIDTITHLTKTGLTIWGGKYGHWKFNPFA